MSGPKGTFGLLCGRFQDLALSGAAEVDLLKLQQDFQCWPKDEHGRELGRDEMIQELVAAFGEQRPDPELEGLRFDGR